MSTDKVVYKSTHPDVLAHHIRHTERSTAWHHQLKTAIADLGFEGANVWMADNTVAGIVRPRGAEVPHGWRWDRTAAEPVIVPARKTAEGKRLGRLLEGLTRPDVRTQMPGGMPRHSTAAREIAFLSCGFVQVGGAVFVTWSTEIRSSDADRIDPAVWERIKLSEFYAAIEAQSEAAS
jgi:hypothetical protein